MNRQIVKLTIILTFVLFLFIGKTNTVFGECNGTYICNVRDIDGDCRAGTNNKDCSGSDEAACLTSIICGVCGWASSDCWWTTPCDPTSWSACTESCGGGTKTNACGTTVDCNTQACCNAADPDKPTLSAPANGTELRVGVATTLDWNDIASWGTKCPEPNSNSYNVCLDTTGSSGCNIGRPNVGVNSQYSWTPSVAYPTVYWAANASNGSKETWSDPRSLCVEGFNAANPSYVGAWTPACGWQTRSCKEDCGGNDCASIQTSDKCQHCDPTIGEWSVCGANHKRTRTCTDNDGTCDGNDCPALSEDCVGTITGTLFDASDVTYCPGSFAGVPTINGQSFNITSHFGKFIHTWPPGFLTNPMTLTTNGSGVYFTTAFAPGTYTYDFSALSGDFIDTAPKFSCGGAAASLPGCLTTDLTQNPCVTSKTTNDFGFWRIYGGWWQAVGGSVYAKNGLKSDVPASVPPLASPYPNQRLILTDTDGRTGVLSHGFAWQGTELGTNPNVNVSDDRWRIQSTYEGLRYDYDYYTTRMSIFDSTVWDGSSAITYSDAGGYQILKSTNPSTTLGALNLSAGQKLIILVDGSVSVTEDIVVPNGAFLAVIAKGNITFDSILATAQGWFVAENINVPCHDATGDGCDKDDSQFVGEGSFVGWSNISLARDMKTLNNDNPSEKFVYRSDFVLNVPTPMKVYTKKYLPFTPEDFAPVIP